jgi:flagellin
MSELALLAQDVTKTDADRALYDKEFQALKTYVDDVATRDFNGVSLFSGAELNVTTDADGGRMELTGIDATYLSSSTAPSAPVGYTGDTPLGDLTTKFADNTAPFDFVVYDTSSPYPNIDFNSTDTIDDLVSFFNGTGGQTSASYNSTTGEFTLTVASGVEVHDWGEALRDLGMSPSDLRLDHDAYTGPATFSATLTVTPPPAPDPDPLEITTVNGAASTLATVKEAITQLAADRATVGAGMARLKASMEQLGTLKENLFAAASRIKDVNVAEESTLLARYNILVQAGTAMLSQANSTPASVLRLLN